MFLRPLERIERIWASFLDRDSSMTRLSYCISDIMNIIKSMVYNGDIDVNFLQHVALSIYASSIISSLATIPNKKQKSWRVLRKMVETRKYSRSCWSDGRRSWRVECTIRRVSGISLIIIGLGYGGVFAHRWKIRCSSIIKISSICAFEFHQHTSCITFCGSVINTLFYPSSLSTNLIFIK